MLEIGIKFLSDVASLIIAFLINQLSSISEFPGKNWLIFRLILWLTVTLAVPSLALEANETVSIVLWCACAASAMGLIFDGMKLIGAARRSPIKDNNGLVSSELLRRLHSDVRLRVKERLNYAVGSKSFINVLWESQPEAIGKSERQENSQEQNWWLRIFPVGRSEPCIGKSIVEVFNQDDINRKLLILGEPGSGKTTTLLKLAEALMAQADATLQVPYIFELSLWRDDQEILDWLTDQLKLYCSGIDPKTSRRWIQNNQIIPLLDGLDELSMKRQKRCIRKINSFVDALPRQHVVVCCRTEEYDEGQVKLSSLNGALCLQPLTQNQIKQYLQRSNHGEVWKYLKGQPKMLTRIKSTGVSKDPAMPEIELLQIPLFLQMLVVAYRTEQTDHKKVDLFDEYIPISSS